MPRSQQQILKVQDDIITSRKELLRFQRSFYLVDQKLDEAIAKHANAGIVEKLIREKRTKLAKVTSQETHLQSLYQKAKDSWK